MTAVHRRCSRRGVSEEKHSDERVVQGEELGGQKAATGSSRLHNTHTSRNNTGFTSLTSLTSIVTSVAVVSFIPIVFLDIDFLEEEVEVEEEEREGSEGREKEIPLTMRCAHLEENHTLSSCCWTTPSLANTNEEEERQ